MSALSYAKLVSSLVERIQDTQMDTIKRLATTIADSIEKGGVLHVFGSGHSHMVAEDVFFRAGGLACVNAMLEFPLMELNVGRATRMERLHGYGDVILSGYHMEPGEVVIVVSNSGINAVPIEVAAACKAKGLTVAAITSRQHSEAVASRHRDGLKLTDIADIIIDNCSAAGDAALQLDRPEPIKYGPTSTISGILIIQMIVAETVTILANRDVVPPLFTSANQPGSEGNETLMRSYQERVRYFPKSPK